MTTNEVVLKRPTKVRLVPPAEELVVQSVKRATLRVAISASICVPVPVGERMNE